MALTVDQWIAISSSSGALIAACIAAYSIRELRIQRAQQFQPRISPTKSEHTIHSQAESLPDLNRADLTVPLINVGHGVATDLRIGWRLPLDRWITKVNTINAERDAGLFIARTDFGLGVRYRGKELGGTRTPETLPNTIPYIVPVTTDQTPVQVPVPCSVTLLLTAYYLAYFKVTEGSESFRNPKPVFDFEMEVNFKDTIGRQFNQSVTFVVSALFRPDDGYNMAAIELAFDPVRTEPAEGYSIVTKALLASAKLSFASIGTPIGAVEIVNAVQAARRKR